MAHVYRIPVRIDYRWFVIFGLSVWLMASSLEQGIRQGIVHIPPMSTPVAWVLGMVIMLALFLSIFGHELSHALVGRAEGIETEEIVLHPFGGFARLRREPDNPRVEFRIAVAGPAASFIFAVLAFGATIVAEMARSHTTFAIFLFIGAYNLLLAIFNLFPGYPLDGGRVLRALLWRQSGDIMGATRIAGLCGQFIAWTLIVFGLYIVIAWDDKFMGLSSILVGLFLLDAAMGIVKGVRGAKAARFVADAMTAPIAVEPDTLVSHFVDAILPLHRQTSFPVAHQRRLHGILMLEDLKTLPRERWRQVRARDVMRPIGPQLFVEPSTPMARAHELMKQNGTGSLAVIDKTGHLVGFLNHRKSDDAKRK